MMITFDLFYFSTNKIKQQKQNTLDSLVKGYIYTFVWISSSSSAAAAFNVVVAVVHLIMMIIDF